MSKIDDILDAYYSTEWTDAKRLNPIEVQVDDTVWVNNLFDFKCKYGSKYILALVTKVTEDTLILKILLPEDTQCIFTIVPAHDFLLAFIKRSCIAWSYTCVRGVQAYMCAETSYKTKEGEYRNRIFEGDFMLMLICTSLKIKFNSIKGINESTECSGLYLGYGG